MDADELYRLAPEEFTAARDAAARQRKRDGDAAGAKELHALRRPSTAAWLVNRLVRASPDLVADLLALGPELAEAQADGDAPALRALGDQRRRLVDAVTSTAVEACGRPVTAAVRTQVAQTLEAALADPGSADAVRSGRLVRALSYAGLGTVDLAGAVAPSAREPERRPRRAAAVDDDQHARQHRERVRAAEVAAQDAAGRLDDAVRACERAEGRRTGAEQAAQQAQTEVERAAEQLRQRREEHARTADAARAAAAAVEQARSAVAEAQRASESARQHLDELRRGP